LSETADIPASEITANTANISIPESPTLVPPELFVELVFEELAGWDELLLELVLLLVLPDTSFIASDSRANFSIVTFPPPTVKIFTAEIVMYPSSVRVPSFRLRAERLMLPS
jgi:hypothetical protein